LFTFRSWTCYFTYRFLRNALLFAFRCSTFSFTI